jgi:hypothetical protein
MDINIKKRYKNSEITTNGWHIPFGKIPCDIWDNIPVRWDDIPGDIWDDISVRWDDIPGDIWDISFKFDYSVE